jgi:hypothetical protein
MSGLIRLVTLILVAGAALTLIGSFVARYFEESQQIRRAFRRVFGSEADVLVVAVGRGTGAGLNFKSSTCAVTSDSGAWCLIYRIDELVGAEMIIDGQVVARAFRGEPRRALEQVATQASTVTLRLVFDDVHHPDFELDLWRHGDEIRKGKSPSSAVQEANRWLARSEAILRRPQGAQSPAPAIAPPARDLALAPWNAPATDLDDEHSHDIS